MPSALKEPTSPPRPQTTRQRSPVVGTDRVVTAAMEGLVLLLVAVSPWVYGAVHPGFEFLLRVGVALLLGLWGFRLLLQGQLRWKKEPVALALASLFLLAMGQVTSLPRPVLALLSPATTRLNDQLLPEQPEVLPEGVDGPRQEAPPGTTPSLYPAATRREALRLLAVFLVFAVVRNNLVSSAAFGRLSIVVLFNGALLSLLGLAQFFSSPHDTVYWTYRSLGQVFGPFINHNHFAEYVNLCIGLGVGLLVNRSLPSSTEEPVDQSQRPGVGGALVRLLHDPPSLWIYSALALMVSSVAFSRSRGGLVALVGAAVVCAVVGRLRLGRSFRLGSLLLVGALAFGLLSWFGLDLLQERFATLWTGKAYESRVPLWLRSLPIAADFPLCGAGLGVYGFLEPLYRVHVPQDVGIFYDHAHNEYLEILIEAGVPGLLLAVLIIALAYRKGFRALGRQKTSPVAGLALGGLFAFTTVVIHSVCEFGLHVPALAFLAAVLTAQLCALGAAKPQGDSPAGTDDTREYCLRLGGLAPLAGAVTVAALGLLLAASGWKAQRVDRLQHAALQTGQEGHEPLRRRVTLLAAAATLAPEDANLHCLLGQARVQMYQQDTVRRLLGRSSGSPHDVLALQAYLRARDACPLSDEAQLGIATLARRLRQGDPQEAYLRRVELLAPSHPERWYLCGRLALESGRADLAWASWRRALELSPDYLEPILPAASARLDAAALRESVLPDDAGILLAAAQQLYPDPDDTPERQPFLEKALELLQSRPAPWQAEDFRLAARIHQGLEQTREAVAAYRELVRRAPHRVAWRLEFARYLYEIHDLEEARRELVFVLNQEPEQNEARDLLQKVTRELLRQHAENRGGDSPREK